MANSQPRTKPLDPDSPRARELLPKLTEWLARCELNIEERRARAAVAEQVSRDDAA